LLGKKIRDFFFIILVVVRLVVPVVLCFVVGALKGLSLNVVQYTFFIHPVRDTVVIPIFYFSGRKCVGSIYPSMIHCGIWDIRYTTISNEMKKFTFLDVSKCCLPG